MSLNKSFASFTLSNAVLGKIEESSLIMATFPPMSSFVSVLASWYQASPPTEASIAVMSIRLHREGAYSVQHILASWYLATSPTTYLSLRRSDQSLLVPPPSIMFPATRTWRSKISDQPLLVRSTSILSTAFEEADCHLKFVAAIVISCFEGLSWQFEQLSRTWPQAQVALWTSQRLALYCFSSEMKGIDLSNFSWEVEVDNVPHAMATNDVNSLLMTRLVHNWF
jgi:hypothetical protein